MTDLARLITALAQAEVRFIVVGGMAGIAHGSARVTFDIDCVYDRDPDNIAKLARALAPFQMNVIGLDASIVRGSHGRLRARAADGPVFLCTDGSFRRDSLAMADVRDPLLDLVARG